MSTPIPIPTTPPTSSYAHVHTETKAKSCAASSWSPSGANKCLLHLDGCVQFGVGSANSEVTYNKCVKMRSYETPLKTEDNVATSCLCDRSCRTSPTCYFWDHDTTTKKCRHFSSDTKGEITTAGYWFGVVGCYGIPDACPPETPVPDTPAPPTDAPKTNVPDTDVPKTDAPKTDVPKTDVPKTDAPPTDAPTPVPKTDVPDTDIPMTDIPMTDVPKTDVPDTDIPMTDVPKTDVPKTDVPKTDVPKTNVPDTDVPKTDVPDTDVPKTDVPKTDVPMTNVPDTDVPKTDVPDTEVPKTDVPKTSVPDTDIPATNSPPTDAPTSAPTDVPPTPPPTPVPGVFTITKAPPQATPLPPTVAPTPAPTAAPTSAPTEVPGTPTPQTEEPALQALMTISPEVRVDTTPPAVRAVGETIGGAAIVGLSAGAALGGQRLLMALGTECGKEDDRSHDQLPFNLHPTRLSIGDTDLSFHVGAIIGNIFVITLGFTLVHLVVCTLLKRLPCLPLRNTMEVQGFLRFPAVTMFLFFFLLQGTSLAAARLAFSGGSYALLGAGTFLMCLGFMGAVYWILQSVHKQALYYQDETVTPCQSYFVGEGEWLSLSNNFIDRFGVMFRRFAPHATKFVLYDMSLSVGMSLASAVKAKTMKECGHKRMAMAVMTVLYCVLLVFVKPFAHKRNNHSEIVGQVLQTIGLVLIAAGFYSEDRAHWTFDAGTYTILLAMMFLLLKTIGDGMAFLFVQLKGRRPRLYREMKKALTTEQLEEELLERPMNNTQSNMSWNGLLSDLTGDYSTNATTLKNKTNTTAATTTTTTTGPESVSARASGLSNINASMDHRPPSLARNGSLSQSIIRTNSAGHSVRGGPLSRTRYGGSTAPATASLVGGGGAGDSFAPYSSLVPLSAVSVASATDIDVDSEGEAHSISELKKSILSEHAPLKRNLSTLAGPVLSPFAQSPSHSPKHSPKHTPGHSPGHSPGPLTFSPIPLASTKAYSPSKAGSDRYSVASRRHSKDSRQPTNVMVYT